MLAGRMCLKVRPRGCPGGLQAKCVRKRRVNLHRVSSGLSNWRDGVAITEVKKTEGESAFLRGEAGKEH